MGRLPDSSSGACIAWYGGARDSAEKGALAVLDVGSFLVDVGNNQSDNGTSADTSELYLNGFLRQYDEKTLGSPAESVMKLVTWIVIFAAFLHFTRLRRIKDQNDAGQAGALSLVFLTWGIWYFGQQCLPPQFWEWIHSVLRGLFRGPSSGFGGSYSSGEFLLKSGSAPLDAYAYACAMLFAFLPFYFHKAEAAFLENPGDVINKKGIWTIVRLLWLLIVFAGVIALGSTDAPRFSPRRRALRRHDFANGHVLVSARGSAARGRGFRLGSAAVRRWAKRNGRLRGKPHTGRGPGFFHFLCTVAAEASLVVRRRVCRRVRRCAAAADIRPPVREGFRKVKAHMDHRGHCGGIFYQCR